MGHFQPRRMLSPSAVSATHATCLGGPLVRRSAMAPAPAVDGDALEAVISAEGERLSHCAREALSGTGRAEWPAWQPTHLVPVPNRPAFSPGTWAGPLAARSTRPRPSTSCSN